MKLAMLTPGISTGYWNPRNIPARARSSIFISNRFFPSYSAVPAVTSKRGLPAITEANVLLPEPFGPMMACTSPAFTVKSMPRSISLPSIEAWRPLTVNMFFILLSLCQYYIPTSPGPSH